MRPANPASIWLKALPSHLNTPCFKTPKRQQRKSKTWGLMLSTTQWEVTITTCIFYLQPIGKFMKKNPPLKHTHTTMLRNCSSFLRQLISFCKYCISLSFILSRTWGKKQKNKKHILWAFPLNDKTACTVIYVVVDKGRNTTAIYLRGQTVRLKHILEYFCKHWQITVESNSNSAFSSWIWRGLYCWHVCCDPNA